MCAYHVLYDSNLFHFCVPCLSLQHSHTHANVSGLDNTNSFFQSKRVSITLAASLVAIKSETRVDTNNIVGKRAHC